jgi:hypothetical protein
MIIMMTYITEEHRAIRDIGELTGFFQRQSVLRRPPGVKVAAVIASQPGAPPTAIHSLRGLIVQAAGVNRKPLHEKGSSTADGVAPVL